MRYVADAHVCGLNEGAGIRKINCINLEPGHYLFTARKSSTLFQPDIRMYISLYRPSSRSFRSPSATVLFFLRFPFAAHLFRVPPYIFLCPSRSGLLATHFVPVIVVYELICTSRWRQGVYAETVAGIRASMRLRGGKKHALISFF